MSERRSKKGWTKQDIRRFWEAQSSQEEVGVGNVRQQEAGLETSNLPETPLGPNGFPLGSEDGEEERPLFPSKGPKCG